MSRTGFASTFALLLLAGSARSAPIAPCGSDPSGGGPRPGQIEPYAAAGLPGSAVGADAGLGPARMGIELGLLSVGALRPELHARLPIELGPARLAPRLSLASSFPWVVRWEGMPSDKSLEASLGLVAALSRGAITLFMDGGGLSTRNFERKVQMRLYGTAAAGARLAIGASASLAAYLSALVSIHHMTPGGGLAVSYRFGR